MATSNFQVFDPGNSNMTSDSDYSTDTARLNGVSNGAADPLSANKAWHQSTIMATAVAQFLVTLGYSVSDTDLNVLADSIRKGVISGSYVSFADRIAHGLTSNADIGQISFCAPQPVPSAALYATSTAGNLNGGYHYREVFISGFLNLDGTYFVRGFSPAAQRSSYDVSPSSQQVSITSIPVGAAGCIGRAIYRSAANGAAGSEKFCAIIWDNTTTSYTDNISDSQLGTGMPSVQGMAVPVTVPMSNNTGTSLTTGGYVRQSSAPANTALLWIDSSNGNILKYFSGSAWVPVPATWG